MPTLRFLRSKILCRFYKSPSDETEGPHVRVKDHTRARKITHARSCHIRLRLVDFLAFCFRSRVLVYILCSALFFLGVLPILTWLVFVIYHVPLIFCFQCLSRRFLKAFSVPANSMFGGKLFQLLITLLVKMCILIRKNCLIV